MGDYPSTSLKWRAGVAGSLTKSPVKLDVLYCVI